MRGESLLGRGSPDVVKGIYCRYRQRYGFNNRLVVYAQGPNCITVASHFGSMNDSR
jgi:hypothetical protein